MEHKTSTVTFKCSVLSERAPPFPGMKPEPGCCHWVTEDLNWNGYKRLVKKTLSERKDSFSTALRMQAMSLRKIKGNIAYMIYVLHTHTHTKPRGGMARLGTARGLSPIPGQLTMIVVLGQYWHHESNLLLVKMNEKNLWKRRIWRRLVTQNTTVTNLKAWRCCVCKLNLSKYDLYKIKATT